MHASRKSEYIRRGARPARSNSQSNLNQLDSGDRRATYGGGLHRSNSNSNLRTPQSANRTPHINRSPVRATPLTANNDQIRQNVTENCQKVMKVLQMDNTFFSRLNLVNGLKSMSAKQFVEIIAHFSMKISGKNMITIASNATSNGKQQQQKSTTPEVEILSFLQMLRYPYVINKSCLKTPNAQHMFKDSVALLAWLSDIIFYSQKDELIEMPMNGGDEFPNEKYTKHFSIEVRNAFHLWNEESDEEFANVQDGLVESFLKTKRGCTSMEEMAQKCEDLKVANVRLAEALALNDHENELKMFDAIQAKYMELKKESEELKRINATRAEAIKSLKIFQRVKEDEKMEKTGALETLIEQIAGQKYNLNDVQRVNDEITLIRKAIASMNQEIETIRGNATDIQIKVARLKQQRIVAINELNTLGFEIVKILAKSQDYGNTINVNDLAIDASANEDMVRKICMRLERISDNVAAHKQHIQHIIDQQNVKITNLNTQREHLKSELINLKTKFQKVDKNHATIEAKLMQFKTEAKLKLTELQMHESSIEFEQIHREITTKRALIVTLETENLKILQDGENCIYKIIESKQKMLQDLDNVNKFLDQLNQKSK